MWFRKIRENWLIRKLYKQILSLDDSIQIWFRHDAVRVDIKHFAVIYHKPEDMEMWEQVADIIVDFEYKYYKALDYVHWCCASIDNVKGGLPLAGMELYKNKKRRK